MGSFEHGVRRVAMHICALSVSVVIASVVSGAHAQVQQSAPATQKRWSTPPPSSNDSTSTTDSTSPPPSAAGTPGPPANKPWREAMERETPKSPEPTPKERIYYGWQTLLVDGLGIGLIVFAAGANESDVALIGVGVLTIGGPLLHFVHENTQGGLISLGIRALSLGLFVLGGFIAANTIFDDNSSDDDTEALVGGALVIVGLGGEITAVVVDASVLAFVPAKTRSARKTAAGVAPWIDPQRGSYGLRFGLAL